MSRLQDFQLIHATLAAGRTVRDNFVVWEPETEAFAFLCTAALRLADFDGIERKRKNWFCLFTCGPNRYRWQMPDEETARRVEQYASSGGGIAYARRKAVRSYKFDDEAGRWKLLNVKNSKKWATQRAERARLKRKKRARQRAKLRALEKQRALLDEQQQLIEEEEPHAVSPTD